MTVQVRFENSEYPLFRVLIADAFGSDGSGPWTEISYLEPGLNGVVLQSVSRRMLPAIGDCTLTMEYGTIDGEDVTPVDLIDYHIRLQAARRPANDTDTPQWLTIWLGRCEWQRDAVSPGSGIPRGTRTYYCVDLLRTYLAGYRLDRHANYAVTGALSYGHPGYNTEQSERSPTADVLSALEAMGNKESTDSGYSGPDSTTIANFATVDSAAGVTTRAWTDAEIAENILLLRRATGDPIFALDIGTDGGDHTVLDGLTSLPISDGEDAWSAINRLLDRRRGKGAAFLDWDDDRADPTGAINVYLRVWPQFYYPITYEWPAGTDNIITGAAGDADFTTNVDLEGDHRLVDDVFELRETTDSAADELTTEGERIETVVTASGYDGTMVYRWQSALETAWSAAGDAQSEAKYRPVLQYYGVMRTAAVAYENGDGADAERADYWTDADGTISNDHTCITAPESVEVLSDLPLYEGYDYSLTPPAPAASADPDGKPRRRKPLLLVRTTTNRFLTPKDYMDGGASVSVDEDGIWVEWSGDDDGLRSVRSTWPGVSSRTVTEASLTFTIGLRMPQRVRFTTTVSAGTVRRRRVIRIADRHLWIAHPGAIWDLNTSTENADGCQAKRIGGVTDDGGNGKILRDDRAALARTHALAWEWYRSDAYRLAATWGIRDCGLLGTWTDLTGSSKRYPLLGQVVHDMTAGGDTYSIDTPISSVVYDNATGTTTWQTDWTEFDYGNA